MKNIKVRELTELDLDLYKSLRLASLKDSPDSFGSTFDAEEKFTKSDWLVRIKPAEPGVVVYPVVAEIENIYAGIACGVVHPNEKCSVHIYQMWVSPTLRGRGIGRMLLDNIVSWAKKRGNKKVVLSVTVTNDAAIFLYSSAGFVASGELTPLRQGVHIYTQNMILDFNRPNA